MANIGLIRSENGLSDILSRLPFSDISGHEVDLVPPPLSACRVCVEISEAKVVSQLGVNALIWKGQPVAEHRPHHGKVEYVVLRPLATPSIVVKPYKLILNNT